MIFKAQPSRSTSDVQPATYVPWRYYWFAFVLWTLLIILSWRLAPRSLAFEALGENWAGSILLIGAMVPKQAFKALLALTLCVPLLLLIHAQVFALVARQGPAPRSYQIAALTVPLLYGLIHHRLTARHLRGSPIGAASDRSR